MYPHSRNVGRRLLLALAAVWMSIASPPGLAQTSGYETWQSPEHEPVAGRGGGDDALPSLIDELRGLVEQAERARAADRRFLDDLRDLIRRFDWPWQVELLSEDFTDGRIAPSPPWSVLEGEFRAEWGTGLRSVVSSKASEPKKSSSRGSGEELAAALLEQLLKQGKQNRNPPAAVGSAQRAAVQVTTPFTNAFALDAEVRCSSPPARMEIGLYQAEPRTNAYLLAIELGQRPSVQVLRASARGVSVIEASSPPIEPRQDGTIAVKWLRDRAGEMSVSVNGETVLTTVDRGLQDPFEGLTFTNLEGDISVRKIVVHGVTSPDRS